MILTGIGDEAGATLESQIAAVKELGWSHIEMRGVQVGNFPKGNFHDIPEEAFRQCAEELHAAGIVVHCFGSAIMNWSKKLSDPFEPTLAEVKRCIPRMKQLGTKFVRIMSYKPDDGEQQIPQEVFRRVRTVTQMLLDTGLQPVHENCMNHGGMSPWSAMWLLEEVPGLKWVFDTGNPVFNADRSQQRPWPRQDPWKFWTAVRDRVAHIHVKDVTWNPAAGKEEYNWPGEGQGQVRLILQDAFAREFDGGISIEPHMVTVFHDPQAAVANDEACRKNFVEYGRRLEKLLAEVGPKPQLAAA